MLAEALARGEARHIAVKRNRDAIEAVREVWRRSGGARRGSGTPELAALYERQLDGVRLDEFRSRQLRLDLDALVPPRCARRTGAAEHDDVRGREVEIQYDVDEDEAGLPYGVVRLRLPEKLARTLVAEEVPALDRPVRFVVLRGQRGAVRAATLEELQGLLDLPWSPGEDEGHDRGRHRSSRAQGDRGDRGASQGARRNGRDGGGRDGARDGARSAGGPGGRFGGGGRSSAPKRRRRG